MLSVFMSQNQPPIQQPLPTTTSKPLRVMSVTSTLQVQDHYEYQTQHEKQRQLEHSYSALHKDQG